MARHELHALGNQKAEIQRWVVHNHLLAPQLLAQDHRLGISALNALTLSPALRAVFLRRTWSLLRGSS
jgi:hypothetical protein